MAAGDKIKWKDADFKWSLAPTDTTEIRYTWNDVKVLEEALGEGGAGVMAEDMPWTKWGDEDDRKKRLIKLICKVKGKTTTEEKEIQNYKIKISDIKLAAEEVLGIELVTENIKF